MAQRNSKADTLKSHKNDSARRRPGKRSSTKRPRQAPGRTDYPVRLAMSRRKPARAAMVRQDKKQGDPGNPT
jgi:hypothetical protein